MTNVYLIGFMGAGKTTVGRLLADALRCDYVDLDELIVSQEGLSIPQIFEQKGEPAFRDIERNSLRSVSVGSNQVVATGGGIIEKVENLRTMSSTGRTVFLDVDLETLLERISSSDSRPLAAQDNNWQRTRQLYEKRLPIYRQADFLVNANGKAAAEITSEIKRLLNDD